jgi:hypothetical protein
MTDPDLNECVGIATPDRLLVPVQGPTMIASVSGYARDIVSRASFTLTQGALEPFQRFSIVALGTFCIGQTNTEVICPACE